MAVARFKPATRLLGVQESTTLRLNTMVKELQAQGRDIINLTAGEPDGPVPQSVQDAAIQAIRDGKSKYTAVAGIPELRAKIAQRYAGVSAAQVVVSNGAKQALYQALQALVSPGQEVIVPAPYWLSYPDMVRLAMGKPRVVQTRSEQQYKLTPEALKKALGPKSRVLILNSPSNPTGMVYTREELQALGEVLRKHRYGKKLWVVSDEIYESLVFDPARPASFWDACPELRDRTLVASGFSKSAAMTGWRVGWAVAPQELAEVLVRLQGQVSSNVNSVAQWASLAALDLPEAVFAAHRKEYKMRRDTVIAAFQNLMDSRTIKGGVPQGAFYFWFEVDAILRKWKLADSTALAEQLLEKAGVALVPGEPFGAPRSLRLSYATSLAQLREGCARIVRFLERAP